MVLFIKKIKDLNHVRDGFLKSKIVHIRADFKFALAQGHSMKSR